jgi:hypothetical protein
VVFKNLIALRGLETVKLHAELLVSGRNSRISYSPPCHLDAWEKEVGHDSTSSKSILSDEALRVLVLAPHIGGKPPVLK